MLASQPALFGRLVLLVVVLFTCRVVAQVRPGEGMGGPGSSGTGGLPAPEWELVVTTYAPPAAPVELPRGRTFSTESDREKKIRETLTKPATANFIEAQLGDVATDLSLNYQIDVQLDVEALAADGKGFETLITAKLRDVPLEDALERMLGGLGMTHLIKHDVLLITTKAAASQPENLFVKFYEMQDLVVMPNDEAILAPLFRDSHDALHSVRTQDWAENGGTIGQARYYEGPGILALVVMHDMRGHREVEQLLDRMRKAKNPELVKLQATKPLVVNRTRLKATTASVSPFIYPTALDDSLPTDVLVKTPFLPPPATSVPSLTEAEQKLRTALDRPGEVQFLDTPLSDVAAHFSKVLDRQVVLDLEALAADGKGNETPISRVTRHTSNRSALKLVLNGQGLTYLSLNNTVVITTKAAASQPMHRSVRVYPVQDLVLTPQAGTATFPDFDSLIELLTGMVRTMDDWSDNGGTISTMRPYSGPGTYSLVVRGSEDYHEEVEQILRLLRKARVQEVFDAQAKRRTMKPTSVKVLPSATP